MQKVNSDLEELIFTFLFVFPLFSVIFYGNRKTNKQESLPPFLLLSISEVMHLDRPEIT